MHNEFGSGINLYTSNTILVNDTINVIDVTTMTDRPIMTGKYVIEREIEDEVIDEQEIEDRKRHIAVDLIREGKDPTSITDEELEYRVKEELNETFEELTNEQVMTGSIFGDISHGDIRYVED